VPRDIAELTSVSDDDAVVHVGEAVRHHTGLAPDTDHHLDGFRFRTLPRPGALLCRFATVNDVHFGERECGVIQGLDLPVFSVPPGAVPYPELMNRAACDEIEAIAPAAVLVKGDLTDRGTPAEYDDFLACYSHRFGSRLHHCRGNHDAYQGATIGPRGPRELELPGVRLAMLDTVRPGHSNGTVPDDQLDWLDELAARTDRPVLVFGHHHVWDPAHDDDVEWYFGIRPRESEALAAVVARRPAIRGYFAGHTHRNRVVHLAATGRVPWVEVASVKDYPGSWAEYRVFERGILQVHRRVSSPAALAWTNRTRGMYAPVLDYEPYALGRLGERCFLIPTD
jgi:predicted phosphodiesterase